MSADSGVLAQYKDLFPCKQRNLLFQNPAVHTLEEFGFVTSSSNALGTDPRERMCGGSNLPIIVFKAENEGRTFSYAFAGSVPAMRDTDFQHDATLFRLAKAERKPLLYANRWKPGSLNLFVPREYLGYLSVLNGGDSISQEQLNREGPFDLEFNLTKVNPFTVIVAQKGVLVIVNLGGIALTNKDLGNYDRARSDAINGMKMEDGIVPNSFQLRKGLADFFRIESWEPIE